MNEPVPFVEGTFGLTGIPRHHPEPPEQGRSVFELMGDEMDDLALALHLARHHHEPVAVPGRWRVMTSPAACAASLPLGEMPARAASAFRSWRFKRAPREVLDIPEGARGGDPLGAGTG